MINIEREEWSSLLALVPESELLGISKDIPNNWIVQPKLLPQTGLGMMKMRDSALNEEFYLGEFILSNCWIVIKDQTGEIAEGATWIMDASQEKTETIALCDAILSHQLTGWEKVNALLQLGLSIKQEKEKERKTILAKTIVDFSLLDEAENEHS